jgi:pectate lyase
MNVNTTEELDKVIHAVNVTATRIKEIEAAKKKATLAVGDTVTFTGKRNKKMEGVITKMKIKNAIVKCKNDQGEAVLWDCPFTMLEVVS